ncbi:Resolvase [Dunaliella salina]|uniref:Resolvase n=1 Tax=Dunaliella salina TaxID=3046 RepID=A0ABQ7G582_DUNSA|nr:Resolvase [Dunaliella salina]|eukprot:KAF5829763.1 Resolvase [Dunaliella salina]
MNEFITTKEAKAALGVSEETLRRWADKGLFPSIRTPGNQRLYCIKQYLQNKQYQEPQQKNICYCRVSSQGQKDDLQRQIQYMQGKFPNHQIISDIGSGLNFKRKGLQTILEMSSKGLLAGGSVVVSYRDRISRFAFELVERILQLHGVQLMVLHEEMEGSEHGELVEDLLAIINVFNCRINGKRKYKEKRKSQSNVETASE